MTMRSHLKNFARRRGIALVLVMLVMAIVAVMAYAMLSASSVQATAGGNGAAAAVARAQAESGIHLALYELLNGNVSSSGVMWTDVTFSTTASPQTTMPGSVTVQIGALTNHCVSVVSTGSSGSSSGGGAVTRTITAEVQVGSPYQVNEAGAFNTTVTLASNVTFTSATATAPALAASGNIINSGHINGNVVIPNSSTFSGSTPSGGSVTNSSSSPAPINGVNDYSQPYTYQGVTYNPVAITSPIGVITNLGPTAGNPLGIYYCAGSLSVTKSLTINGTLQVAGNLTNTSAISITPLSPQASTYLPALVVTQKVTMSGHTAALTANGVVYAGTGLFGVTTNASTNVTINGALLINTGGINGSFAGTAAVTYNPTYANVARNFDVNDWSSTSGVKIIAWSE
jgi:Tfp pilus assembly protein PilX